MHDRPDTTMYDEGPLFFEDALDKESGYFGEGGRLDGERDSPEAALAEAYEGALVDGSMMNEEESKRAVKRARKICTDGFCE